MMTSAPASATTNEADAAAAANLFALAVRQHQAGNLAEAERVYREALARDPNHFDSLHLLGVIGHQSGRFDLAIEMIGRAVVLNDRSATFHNNLAEALRIVGRYAEAATHASRAVELEPNFAEAHMNLGNALKQQGKNDEAAAEYGSALSLKPNYAEAHANLGVARMDQGRLDEAIVCYRRALAIHPNFPAAEMNLGIAFHQKGEWDDAASHYRRALGLAPNYVLAHMNLGDTLFEQGRLDEAVSQYETALRITTGGFGPDSKELKPTESLAVMSTGPRPLYPVEDKCVMSLVRAHCWRDPLTGWDRLCAAALRHDGLCPESRYELAIRTAIQQWIKRDYQGLEATLAHGGSVFDLITKANQNVKNSRAYAGFLQALLSYAGQNPDARAAPGTLPPIPIIGDSHCLAYDGTRLTVGGALHAGVARLIMGCKAWHLGNGTPNRFKGLFETIVGGLPAGSTAICTFGEIDCRLDEGILHHYRKAGGDIEMLVAATVDRFVGYADGVAAPRSLALMFIGVPAPHFAAMTARDPAPGDEDKALLIRIIRLFNGSLERAAKEKGHRYIDVYQASAGADGAASGLQHLDDIHLKPDLLRLALN
jgi:tetratricopeptide (TPR) repeat protein